MAGLARSLHSPLSNSPSSQSSTLFYLTSLFLPIMPSLFLHCCVFSLTSPLPCSFSPLSPLDSHQCDLTLIKGADFSQKQALYTTHALSSLHKEGFADWFWTHGMSLRVSGTSFCLWLLHRDHKISREISRIKQRRRASASCEEL